MTSKENRLKLANTVHSEIHLSLDMTKENSSNENIFNVEIPNLCHCTS